MQWPAFTTADAAGYKACCAAFYEQDAVRFLLGDTWRPGGPKLTQELLEAASLSHGSLVLDLACGLGDSLDAISSFGAEYLGADISVETLVRAKSNPDTALPASWLGAEGEQLPLRSESVDLVLLQCSFSTFPDKASAATEIARVLKPGGRVAISDVTLAEGQLPKEWEGWLARIACLAEALSLEGYESILAGAGFSLEVTRDCGWAAKGFLRSIDQKLLLARIAQAVGKVDFGGIDIAAARRLMKQALEMVDRGAVSYAYLVARRI